MATKTELEKQVLDLTTNFDKEVKKAVSAAKRELKEQLEGAEKKAKEQEDTIRDLTNQNNALQTNYSQSNLDYKKELDRQSKTIEDLQNQIVAGAGQTNEIPESKVNEIYERAKADLMAELKAGAEESEEEETRKFVPFVPKPSINIDGSIYQFVNNPKTKKGAFEKEQAQVIVNINKVPPLNRECKLFTIPENSRVEGLPYILVYTCATQPNITAAPVKVETKEEKELPTAPDNQMTELK